MKCPACRGEMIECSMGTTQHNPHQFCQRCNPNTMLAAMTICGTCQAEYDASVAFRLQQSVRDPRGHAATDWCDDCNDWMPLKHAHKPRKRWVNT